jgi:hypothetical protein
MFKELLLNEAKVTKLPKNVKDAFYKEFSNVNKTQLDKNIEVFEKLLKKTGGDAQKLWKEMQDNLHNNPYVHIPLQEMERYNWLYRYYDGSRPLNV